MTQSRAAQPLAPEPESAPSLLWVVCLCAGWCNTCSDYRATFDAVARQWPGVRFEWVDIEDEAEVTGDVDVETFPTLLVADASGTRFLGPLLPQAGVLTRLISNLQAGASGLAPGVDPQGQALFERVRASRR